MNPAAQTENASTLARECDVFCRYLTGQAASPFIVEKYAEAHARDPRYGKSSTFDGVLLGAARLAPALAHLVDSYAAVGARSSLLRKKLVLLVAILESSSPAHGFDDQITDTPASVVILRMAGRGVLFAVRFVLAAVVLLPLQFVLAVGGGTRERA